MPPPPSKNSAVDQVEPFAPYPGVYSPASKGENASAIAVDSGGGEGVINEDDWDYGQHAMISPPIDARIAGSQNGTLTGDSFKKAEEEYKKLAPPSDDIKHVQFLGSNSEFYPIVVSGTHQLTKDIRGAPQVTYEKQTWNNSPYATNNTEERAKNMGILQGVPSSSS